MNLLAAANSIFGTINAPPGMNTIGADPVVGLGKIISTAISVFLLVAALAMLLYLFLGAFDWINSAGEKEKLVKAQNKMISAVVGMFLIVMAFTVFNLVITVVLGNKVIGNNWTIIIPSVGN